MDALNAPHPPEYCIDRALECERSAEAAVDAGNKAIFIDLARRWRMLAADADDESFALVGKSKPSSRHSD